jgi:uncharacterized membrane protein YkvI
MFNPLKNIALNLQATGTAAIVCVYLICVAAVAIAGTGRLAEDAMRLFYAFGGALIAILSVRR